MVHTLPLLLLFCKYQNKCTLCRGFVRGLQQYCVVPKWSLSGSLASEGKVDRSTVVQNGLKTCHFRELAHNLLSYVVDKLLYLTIIMSWTSIKNFILNLEELIKSGILQLPIVVPYFGQSILIIVLKTLHIAGGWWLRHEIITNPIPQNKLADKVWYIHVCVLKRVPHCRMKYSLRYVIICTWHCFKSEAVSWYVSGNKANLTIQSFCVAINKICRIKFCT